MSYIWENLSITKKIDTYVTQGFEILEIRKTIREAIVITNGLGLRYLGLMYFASPKTSVEDKNRQMGWMRGICILKFM